MRIEVANSVESDQPWNDPMAFDFLPTAYARGIVVGGVARVAASGSEFRCLKRSLNALKEALELRQQVLVFLPRPLDALASRQAENIPARLQRFPYKSAMKDR